MLRRGNNGFHHAFTGLHSLKSFIVLSTSVASKSNVAIASPLMVDYLVKSIGFSEEEAIAIVAKVSHPLKSTKKAELVVDYLNRSGFDGTQIRKLVAGFPNVLKNDVDKTLSPKIRVFQNLGFSGSDLGLFISRHPFLLTRNVESDIVPVFEVLKSIYGSDEQAVRFTLQTKSKCMFLYKSLKNLPANIKLLQSYGVKSEGIKIIMQGRGFPLYSSQWVEKILKRVEENLGIPRTSGIFIYGVYALSRNSEKKIESCLEVFRSYGWSEAEISELLRRNPLVVKYSEESLRVKLKYFMEDLGYGSEYLVTVPTFASYSMEKRILPRVAVIHTLMGLNLIKHTTVFRSIKKSEPEFAKRFVLPYKDELPELYENYIQATGYNPSNA